ncbi:MAG TPA: SpoIIE family protein phosphatase [Bacillus bacterium]|nr:SpoIIE family protein phosphatase [Bacillus sp. (in: firmicutes)]
MKIKDLSLKVKLGAIFTISLILNFIGFFIMIQFIDEHEHDSYLLNLAGRQGMVAQQIVNEAYMYANGNGNYKIRLLDSAKQFEQNQDNLLFGNEHSGIPGIKVQDITDRLLLVSKDWQSFSEKIHTLINAEDSDIKHILATEIQQNSYNLLYKLDHITNLIKQNSELKVAAIKNMQIRIMLVNIIIFLFAIWASINHIINPITEVIKLMQRVADGDIKVKKLKVERTDEVGLLALSFNMMVSNLKHIILTGKVQADFLPPEIGNEKFEIKTIYKPTEYVSGDFFHYIWDKDNNHLYGYLLDVMGHGLDTALHTSYLHVLFEQAAHKNMTMVEKLEWINNESMKYLTNGTFAAGICFKFDFNSNKLTFVSCGINHFIAKTTEQKGLITIEGGLLGILETMPFEEHEITFQPSDYFIFLTDGLLDHLSKNKQLCLNSFQEELNRLETLSQRDFIKDDVSAICINIK